MLTGFTWFLIIIFCAVLIDIAVFIATMLALVTTLSVKVFNKALDILGRL